MSNQTDKDEVLELVHKLKEYTDSDQDLDNTDASNIVKNIWNYL